MTSSSKYATTFIGLGSNLDRPKKQIATALEAMVTLPQCYNLQCAPWYQSQAIGPGEQPDYINTVVKLETTLSARELLRTLQVIEDRQGRQRSIRWGARTLDLDILLYNNEQCDSEILRLPHPQMHLRSFVLLPLYKLAPALKLPNGQTLAELVKRCDCSNLRMVESVTY